MHISIDEGTILLVAEVLKQERGAQSRDFRDATIAVTAAAKALMNESEQSSDPED